MYFVQNVSETRVALYVGAADTTSTNPNTLTGARDRDGLASQDGDPIADGTLIPTLARGSNVRSYLACALSYLSRAMFFNAIATRVLIAAVLGGSSPFRRSVRLLNTTVEYARFDGYPICYLTKTGYFLAEYDEELDIACLWRHTSAKATLGQVATMKGRQLPDLRDILVYQANPIAALNHAEHIFKRSPRNNPYV